MYMEKYSEIMFKSRGRIIFDPMPIMGGNDMFKPFWAIVIVSGDIGDYYRWLLEKENGMRSWLSVTEDGLKYENVHPGLKLQRPAWGAHISFIRGETFTTPYYKIKKGTDRFFREFPKLKNKREFNTDEIYHYLFINEFISQEDVDKWFEFKNMFHKKIIDFEYELTPYTVESRKAHWWLRVKSDELKDIRQEMGHKREGFWGLHLTLGSPTPNTEEYSLILSEKKGSDGKLIYGR